MDEVPEIYSDGVEVQITPYTVALKLNVQQWGPEAPPKVVGHLRMSLEQAKALVIILKRQLRAYEDRLGQPIALPSELYNELGISQHEDW